MIVTRIRCEREGCKRTVSSERQSTTCSQLCRAVTIEMDMAQRVAESTGDASHWVAAVEMNDAVTAFQRSDNRLYRAAREVGISDTDWRRVKGGMLQPQHGSDA